MESNRRNFLKFLLVGGGSFFVGRFVGSNFNHQEFQMEGGKNIGDFKAMENKNEIIFYDPQGVEILILEKGVF